MSTGEHLQNAAILTGITAFTSLANTAIRDHRVWTHRSLEFESDAVGKTARIAGGHLTDTKRWAAVHRIHHSTPDANLTSFVELADYIDWLNDPSANNADHPETPDEIYGLDPAVESIDTETAYAIGSLARELVRDLYQPAEEYTVDEGTRILYDKNPRFMYENPEQMKQDRKHPVRFDPNNLPSLRQVRFMLRDPHSPPLHKMGIPGIMRSNVPLYSYAEHNFEDPGFRPDDLQPDPTDTWIRDNRAKLRIGYVGGMALAGILLARPRTAKEATAGALAGAAASGAAVLALIAGGNITNSLGHAGDINRLTLREFLAGKVHPKSDGTYASDDKRLSFATLDEVGGQRVHHDHPEKIAYSMREGVNKLIDAPFGKFLEFLVSRGILFKQGDQFNNEDQRPDMPSEAVQMLQNYRAKRLAELAQK